MSQCPSCGGICKPSGCERADYVEPKIGCVNHDCDKCKQAQKQKPVAYELVWDSGPTNKDYEDVMRLKRLNQLINSPQRQWVGLTDTDVADNLGSFPIYASEWNESDYYKFARAIEAKLKQKNGYAEEKNT